jgi:hypothetical protein
MGREERERGESPQSLLLPTPTPRKTNETFLSLALITIYIITTAKKEGLSGTWRDLSPFMSHVTV